jgi:hypothetical protein
MHIQNGVAFLNHYLLDIKILQMVNYKFYFLLLFQLGYQNLLKEANGQTIIIESADSCIFKTDINIKVLIDNNSKKTLLLSTEEFANYDLTDTLKHIILKHPRIRSLVGIDVAKKYYTKKLLFFHTDVLKIKPGHKLSFIVRYRNIEYDYLAKASSYLFLINNGKLKAKNLYCKKNNILSFNLNPILLKTCTDFKINNN